MVFTENSVRKIRDYLNLSPESLLPNSALRLRAKKIEDYDNSYGTNLVAEIEDILAQIETIDNAIADNISNNIGVIKKEEVKDEHSVEYATPGTDFNLDYRREKERLIAKIAREFNITRNPYLSHRSRFERQ